ncbi:hypothetical protein HGA88_02985 [Candidatus Roizmanbacteria bacterium]|nr:hypothetical protein [Candidatus Roizmanbacteria bacterium]
MIKKSTSQKGISTLLLLVLVVVIFVIIAAVSQIVLKSTNKLENRDIPTQQNDHNGL